jgi:hypothetical protein
MAVFDSHGDEIDSSAEAAMFQFKEEYWKPHESIHGGDNWNFAALRKGADEYDREKSLKEDYDKGLRFLERYRPKYFCRGNHDERLWDLMHFSKGIIKDFAKQSVASIESRMQRMGVKMIPYDSRYGFLQYGNGFNFMHGYSHSTHCAKEIADGYPGVTLFGHVHAFSSFRIASYDERFGQAVGCLCDINMSFERSRKAKLKKEHGWAYGIKNTKTGACHYWMARKIDGKWILPTDYVTL